jgi:hypothetical protein
VDSTRMVHSFHPVIIIYRTQYWRMYSYYVPGTVTVPENYWNDSLFRKNFTPNPAWGERGQDRRWMRSGRVDGPLIRKAGLVWNADCCLICESISYHRSEKKQLWKYFHLELKKSPQLRKAHYISQSFRLKAKLRPVPLLSSEEKFPFPTEYKFHHRSSSKSIRFKHN